MGFSQVTRAEFGASCPLWPPHGPKQAHDWIETTDPRSSGRRFGCNVCSAWADDPGHQNNDRRTLGSQAKGG